MPRIKYEEYAPKRATLELIAEANRIVQTYTAEGYSLTLRQLYYRLVAANTIPNNQRSYNRLGSILNRARLGGLVDWEALEDRTRMLRGVRTYESVSEALSEAAGRFYMDVWAHQPNRVEVWVEKDALLDIVQRACVNERVDFFSCRGYTSASEMWKAAQRHADYEHRGQDVIVLHLGDHDPSGLDMTRDIEERLWKFGAETYVRRIALNMDQIRAYRLPPNPAKLTDSRSDAYIGEHGRSSWELDSLEPDVLSELIATEIEAYRQDEEWQEAIATEDKHRRAIQSFANTYRG